MDLPVKVWHQYSSTEAIIACGTNYIPESFQPCTNDTLIPRINGTWGPHEYSQQPQVWDAQSPYMAWIPLRPHPDQKLDPTLIMQFRMQNKHFIPNSRISCLGGLDKAIKQCFDDDAISLCNIIQIAQIRAADYISTPPIEFPSVALQRLDEVLLYLTLQDIYYRDCLEAVATLQQVFAELQGFILWSHDIGFSGSLRRTYRLRGALVPDHCTYRTLVRLDVPVWFKFASSGSAHPPAELHVTLSPLETLCEARTWQDYPAILDRTEMPLQPGRNSKLNLSTVKLFGFTHPMFKTLPTLKGSLVVCLALHYYILTKKIVTKGWIERLGD
jgi:hypothetical protein